jgi:hypothetical protein
MIEIILPLVLPDKCVLQFDGRVLELFSPSWESKSHRYHVATISSIEILTDKKGAVSLKVQGTSGYADQVPISPAALADTHRLLGEVKQAMAPYR